MEQERPCCAARTKHREPEEYKALLHRLNRIEGQVRGLKSMLEQEAYCTDVLIQVSAVQAALSAFSRSLLENHLRSCVADGLRAGDEAVIEELTATLKKLMK